MENEKKFNSEMFGYDKKEVEEYIKAIKADYESKLQAEKSESNRVFAESAFTRIFIHSFAIPFLK